MSNKISLAGIICLIALCVGCTIPCHPYDYCGPVYDGSGQYCSNVRAGSILDTGETQPLVSDADQSMTEDTTNVDPESQGMGAIEGAKQILSVTDRKVGDSEDGNLQPEVNQSKPVLAKPASSNLRWR